MSNTDLSGIRNAMKFKVAYTGDSEKTGAMDVHQLAPALLALGDLTREVNFELNGAKIKINLLVYAHIENNSFDILFDLVQTWYEQIKTLIGMETVKSAKEIVEWIGIFKTPVVSLLEYLQIKNGREIESISAIEDAQEKGTILIKLVGDNNRIRIHQNTYNLSRNPRITKSVDKIMRPALSQQFDGIEFLRDNKREVRYTRQDVEKISRSCAASEDDTDAIPPQEITTHLRVYGPVYDRGVEKWRFRYGDSIINADISETSIASDAIERGGAFVGDTYKVRLSITERITGSGKVTRDYKIIEVVSFFRAPEQTDMFLKQQDGYEGD